MVPVVLIVVLGCNVHFLLHDRITTAVHFANHWLGPAYGDKTAEVHWFLSGGTKTQRTRNTEAERMQRLILQAGGKGRFVLDTLSANTAENVVRAVSFIEQQQGVYTQVYFVTSAFHHTRAKLMVDTLSPGNNFHWILSPLQEPSSLYWESVFMRNVQQDLVDALSKSDSPDQSSTFHAGHETRVGAQVV
jgi:uncharacterized SAM-binding protein YcdF (DUF218 family)